MTTLMNIFDFIQNYNLTFDVKSNWFQDLWYPLSKSNPPPRGGVGLVKNRPIIITQNLLEWMGYKGRGLSDKQGKFSKYLRSLDIAYDEIDHTHPLAIEYPCVQNEAKLIPKQLEQKRWICVDQRNFKKAVMRLHTENAEIVRDYYLNLEEAIFAYGEYTMNYLIEKTERERKTHDEELSQLVQQLAIKEKSEEELKLQLEQVEKEAKEKLQRALKFNHATKQVEPQEYIYIATTENYSLENKFKPGGCGSFDLTKSRLSQYNSGKSDSNSHFFVYLRKVVSYRSIEQALLGCLGGFRENANKELYIINFDWLVKCIDAIVDHNTEFLLFVNSNRDQMVEDTMNKAPVVVSPLRLEKIRISYQRIGEEEVELTTILEQDTIDAIKDAIISYTPDNNTIKRIAFETHLLQQHPEIRLDQRKRVIWDIVKKIGVSINPKWRYKY